MESFIASVLQSPEFASALATIFITVVTAVIAFLGKAARDYLSHNLSSAQLNTLLLIAQQAVAVAEQTGATKAAEEKKAEALAIAQTYLDAYGIKVSAAQLDAAIEAAVFNEFNRFKFIAPAEPEADPVLPDEPVTTEASS